MILRSVATVLHEFLAWRAWPAGEQQVLSFRSFSFSPACHSRNAGRVIWVFPADEDKSTLQSQTESNVADEGWSATAATIEDPPRNGAAATIEVPPRDGVTAARPSKDTPPGEGGQVEVPEAMREVEAGRGPDAEEVAAAAAQTGDPRAATGRAVPVAVEASYSSFDRLLLLPECFQDHIPDRYLQVLQQL